MSVPDVSVVVVTYNAADKVRECLAALTGPGRPTVDHEVIVLDNASEPPLAPMLRKWAPEADVVDVGSNVGFARGCNLGAARATGRYILLLNPDAMVRPGTIDIAVHAADRHAAPGVLGGRTVDQLDRLDPRSCWGRPTLWSLFCFATGLSAVLSGNTVFDPESLGRWPRDTERGVPVVTGCFMLVDRGLWEEIGGFDPDYFMYGEDADLCRRVEKRGLRVWIEPRAVVRHDVGASSSSSGAKTVLLLAGRMTYVSKQFHGPARRMAHALLIAGVGLRALGAMVLGRRDAGWLFAWGRRPEWVGGYVGRG